MKHTLRLGLALGGGGARGFAHLGVLIALEENQIPVSVITGTSIGAVIGAAKALEMDLKKLERLLSCLDLNELLQVSSSTTREIQRVIGRGMVEYVRGTSLLGEKTTPERLARIQELFSLLTANKSFSDITIPFAAVAADLETGQRVVLNQGKLSQAAAASAAIPGVFHPVRYRKHFLIDGGVIDKIPASLAIEMGAESILAIDTGAPLASSINTSFDIFLQTYGITSRELTSLQLDAVRK
ncbi:MAG: patatin-like phospholipase family protein, partial [Candidatus Bipolaricaulota bacterium]